MGRQPGKMLPGRRRAIASAGLKFSSTDSLRIRSCSSASKMENCSPRVFHGRSRAEASSRWCTPSSWARSNSLSESVTLLRIRSSMAMLRQGFAHEVLTPKKNPCVSDPCAKLTVRGSARAARPRGAAQRYAPAAVRGGAAVCSAPPARYAARAGRYGPRGAPGRSAPPAKPRAPQPCGARAEGWDRRPERYAAARAAPHTLSPHGQLCTRITLTHCPFLLRTTSVQLKIAHG